MQIGYGELTVARKSIFLKKRIFLSQFLIVVLGAGMLLTGSYWEERGYIGGILFFAGAILAGIAAVGRLWCSIYISGYKKDTLITTGPYSICRNPLYLFSLIGAVGVGLATRTITVPVSVCVLFFMYYPFVIKREEGRLKGLHGGEFMRYCEATPRFFPRISSYREPEEYTIKPAFLRGRFLDSLWFVWLTGLLGLVDSLHHHGIVPVYLWLY